jgi:zinc transport system substrate-binding protein
MPDQDSYPAPPWHNALFLLITALALVGCQPNKVESKPDAAPANRPKVATVNYPLLYFAQRIAGDQIELFFPLPPGESSPEWEPPTDVLRAYQNADLILLNGPSHPAWVRQVALPAARTVDTTSSFRDQYLETRDPITHSHGPLGAHEHTGIRFHTWLDPALARLQARAVLRALAHLLPEHKTQFETRAAELDRDLDQLDRAFEQLFSGASRQWIASHPFYDYFARRYALEIHNLHWEPDEMPDPAEWTHLEELMAERPGAVMIWEDEPLAGIRSRLKSINLPHAVVRPAADPPPEGDLLAIMENNLENFSAALR